MDALIIGKWLTAKYIDENNPVGSAKFNATHYSPPIVTTMIDMFLATASNEDANGKAKYNYVFEGQQVISIILLLIAFASIPVMLMVKPQVLKRRMRA